ncbi:MAG: hypothetical protein Ct9H300mP1_33140 [Planctomycetaceae bacterium]|nr:MAG: hypothetical protein Ct9H300mP1_33140 [Planctomycetaceae bacterium]
MNRLAFALVLFCSAAAWISPSVAADPPKVAGPYKLLAADFTGNGHRDLVIGFHDLGLLTVPQGNGRGRFDHRAITPTRAGLRARVLPTDRSTWPPVIWTETDAPTWSSAARVVL